MAGTEPKQQKQKQQQRQRATIATCRSDVHSILVKHTHECISASWAHGPYAQRFSTHRCVEPYANIRISHAHLYTYTAWQKKKQENFRWKRKSTATKRAQEFIIKGKGFF